MDGKEMCASVRVSGKATEMSSVIAHVCMDVKPSKLDKYSAGAETYKCTH